MKEILFAIQILHKTQEKKYVFSKPNYFLKSYIFLCIIPKKYNETLLTVISEVIHTGTPIKFMP